MGGARPHPVPGEDAVMRPRHDATAGESANVRSHAA
jgi:hypothetical protein